MKKIGITGSLASGKTTASKILSSRKGPFLAQIKLLEIYIAKKNLRKLFQENLELRTTLTLKKL